jgi:nitrite reductase (NO-forming)
LRRASILALAIPGAGAALTGSRDQTEKSDRTAPVSKDLSDTETAAGAARDSAVGGGSSFDLKAVKATRFAPELPPLPEGNVHNIHWHSQETAIRISDRIVVAGWTFEENTPGPIIHCRVGDTINFTLTNDSGVPHSMDFHAARINPKTAFRSVGKGESVSYSFVAQRAGAFLYHCGTPPVLMHIGMGMFGAIIVSPKEPLPPAKEFVLVQSEMYLGKSYNGVFPFDFTKMLAGDPDVVAFNGRPNQYMEDPIYVNRGDRVRFWVVNAGPTLPCAFHLIGEQFETVYLGSPPGSAIHGVQTFSVPPGGGMAFELVCEISGEFSMVNHAMGHGQKGATGHLIVREPEEA